MKRWWRDFVALVGKDYLAGLAIRFVVTFVVAFVISFLVHSTLMGWWAC